MCLFFFFFRKFPNWHFVTGNTQPFWDMKCQLQKLPPLLRGYTHRPPPRAALGNRAMQPHKDPDQLEFTLLPIPISSGTALLPMLFAAACPHAAGASQPAQPEP